MDRSGPLTIEEKRAALDRVLRSDALARADQLKAFLKYVCEMEMGGRAGEISEYLVGVEALGKDKGFSPSDDTSVRNRAYALRRKLEKYYQEEAPGSPVRIEFVKGTYVPRFVEAAAAEARPEAGSGEPGRSPRRWLLPAAMLVAGLAAGAGTALLWLRLHAPGGAPAGALDPLVRRAWGSVVTPGSSTLICMANAAQMTLIPFDVKVEWKPDMPPLPAPLEIYPWYLRHHRLSPGERLFMIADENSSHMGDVLGAVGATRVLTAAGAAYQVLPERLVSTALLSARSSILFGAPHKSEAVFKLLQNGRFRFGYDPKLRDVIITRLGRGQEPAVVYAPRRDDRNDRVESFGLITVSPIHIGSGPPGRVIAFSADPSAGAAAGVQFFSSPQNLAALLDRLRAEGHSGFPPAYQVLIRCRIDSNLVTGVFYETHAVL